MRAHTSRRRPANQKRCGEVPPMNAVRALGAKLVTMLVALVCGVITTRLILGEAGIEYYALYSLLISLPALLSFTDLGSGAVIVNGIAESKDPNHDPSVVMRVTAVGRILLGFAAATMIINTILLLTGLWEVVLGDAGSLPGADLAAWVSLTIFSLGVPIGIWQRVMLGLRRNHIIILLQGLLSPITLLAVWTILQIPSKEAHAFLSVASFFATIFVSVIGFALTTRGTRPLLPTAVSAIVHLRSLPSMKVMDVGWPMLAQLVSYPLAMSAQRYILAQFGTSTQVAQYGVVGQIFFALQALVGAAGVALWPMYANARHEGELRRGPFGLSALFAGGVLFAALVALVGREWIFGFISNGKLTPDPMLIISFGVMVALQGAIYPLGMFIMDKPGIRFQVAPSLLMAASSVGLSFLFAPMFGASGPPIANIISVAVFQIAPYSLYISRHRGRLLSPR